MAVLRAKVTLPATSGIKADDCTNTWHFTGEETDASLIDVALGAFYVAIKVDLSSKISPVLLVDWYNVAQAPPRVPFKQGSYNLTSTGADAFPSEVACVLSYGATPVSGINPQSMRGRIYIGPLASSSRGVGVDSDRPGTPFMTRLKDAGQALLNASNSAQWSWVTYSPKRGTPYTTDYIAVDNAFDTQRRRGVSPTSKVTLRRAGAGPGPRGEPSVTAPE